MTISLRPGFSARALAVPQKFEATKFAGKLDDLKKAHEAVARQQQEAAQEAARQAALQLADQQRWELQQKKKVARTGLEDPSPILSKRVEGQDFHITLWDLFDTITEKTEEWMPPVYGQTEYDNPYSVERIGGGRRKGEISADQLKTYFTEEDLPAIRQAVQKLVQLNLLTEKEPYQPSGRPSSPGGLSVEEKWLKKTWVATEVCHSLYDDMTGGPTAQETADRAKMARD